MRSIYEAMAERPDNPSGFDYLRITLAVSIIAAHATVCSEGHAGEAILKSNSALLTPIMFILPVFFALSGFLVAGSLERNTLPAFLTLRVMRIFPALAVEVALSALIIGPLVTTLPLRDYFNDPLFLRYFLNVTGNIHYILPGVFGGLPLPDFVNAQLWTVPFELDCYIAISIVALGGLVSRPRLFAAVTVVLIFLITAFRGNVGPVADMERLPGLLLVLSFLCGAALYLLRKSVPLTTSLCSISLVLGWMCLQRTSTIYFASIPLAYITVFLGIKNPPRTWLVKHADYSYGVYLYGFPIQQLVSYAFPQHRFALFNFAVALPIAAGCAAISWHCIEKPILSRKSVAVDAINRLYRALWPNEALQRNERA